MQAVNYAFLLSLVIIVMGYGLKQLNIISTEEGKGLSRIILNITLPAVILKTVPSIEFTFAYAVMPIITILYSGMILLVSYFLVKKRPPKEKGLMLMTILSFNVGNFAYPLLDGIWGENAIQYAAMFDIGNAFIIFVVCYIIGAKFSPALCESDELCLEQETKIILKKVVSSVPLLCYFFGILLNLLNIQFPIFISDVIQTIAQANMPIVLLCLGILLDFHFEKKQWQMILTILLVRYSFGILIGICCYIFLPFDLFMRRILFILLILPVGMSLIPYAVEFGYDERAVATICNFSILLSFPLMWGLALFLL